MLNPNTMTTLQWLLTLGGVLSLAILAGRLLWWAPVVMAAGGTANLIELVLRGAVLDWIIIPKGATVEAISVGDVALYIGAVWGIVAVAGNSIRTMREVVDAARSQGTKSEMS
jgi:lipoprotein signal peptidase